MKQKIDSDKLNINVSLLMENFGLTKFQRKIMAKPDLKQS